VSADITTGIVKAQKNGNYTLSVLVKLRLGVRRLVRHNSHYILFFRRSSAGKSSSWLSRPKAFFAPIRSITSLCDNQRQKTFLEASDHQVHPQQLSQYR